MKDLPPLDVPQLLRQHGLQPDRRLGQNFLIDASSLDKVIQAAEVHPEEDVLEIGAGVGNLTRLLAPTTHQVVAVELDPRLMPPLENVLQGFENVRLVQGDILSLDPSELMGSRSYLVVANIPYYITSALLRHLLEARLPPQRLILTVQSEVAERICANQGDLSLLALSVQVYGTPDIVARIPAGAFYPAPKVSSAVIRVDLSPQPFIPLQLLDLFFRLAKAGFSQKRKTLRNALAGGMAWDKDHAQKLLHSAGIDPMRRAETLSLEEWLSLTQAAQRAAS
ncbi:MAG: 16S rRNA (adenine(1518)-N(6)/adenine(1519)-N(6))-dimethyltransferase RsmA [Anaerolineales bacterium]